MQLTGKKSEGSVAKDGRIKGKFRPGERTAVGVGVGGRKGGGKGGGEDERLRNTPIHRDILKEIKHVGKYAKQRAFE